jgi:hypothetical protein
MEDFAAAKTRLIEVRRGEEQGTHGARGGGMGEAWVWDQKRSRRGLGVELSGSVKFGDRGWGEEKERAVARDEGETRRRHIIQR